MDSLDRLSKAIGYEFENKSLLRQALTHRSKNKANYERLEFLGDSILSFVVSDFLYARFPDLGEGRLSRMRAAIVCKESLAEIARELNIGSYLILGEGERKSGVYHPPGVFGDIMKQVWCLGKPITQRRLRSYYFCIIVIST